MAVGPVRLLAQDSDFHHHSVGFSIGTATPMENASQYLGTAPMIRFGYGYRPRPWPQGDLGFQMAFGAAHNQAAVETDMGPIRGGDHEYMIPLGGRTILPLPFKRIEASVGGGGIYLHYSTTAPSGGYGYPIARYTCTSRGGWGAYRLDNVRYFLDENRTFFVGTTFEYISASTNGDAVGNVPALKTTDHWATLSFGLGLSF
jgi:hypothetical protein